MTRIAVLSFPGNNCEVESLRAVKQAGMEAIFFKWNDSKEKLNDIDGYFIPGGFSYEDRGRSGMVAARDPLLQFLHEENERGKVIIGNCNGAQILVESGLIPLDRGLQMSLARNALGDEAVGFINEWVWITPTCKKDRCATSDWSGTMHLPIAHGEGRFTTKDTDVWSELTKQDQMAFSYCDASGKVSEDPVVTPNGSAYAIAGLCNRAGNVVALMPHPERTENGKPYFASMRRWIEGRKSGSKEMPEKKEKAERWEIPVRAPKGTEIFIGTIITNNEERTVEQAAHRSLSGLTLTQLKYVAPKQAGAEQLLARLSFFNPNKETAHVRQGGSFYRWDSDAKKLKKTDVSPLANATVLLRRDEPDTGGAALGQGSETGVCYICRGATEAEILKREVLEVFANPHASTLERMGVIMERSIVLLAHSVRSLWNVGSFFRTADSFAVQKIYLTGYTAAPPRREISKTALGAEEYVLWEKVEDPKKVIAKLKKQGFTIVALEQARGAVDIANFVPPSKVCLIVGHEVLGVPKELLRLSDHIVHIPMHGKKESLNVAVAAGIALYSLRNS